MATGTDPVGSGSRAPSEGARRLESDIRNTLGHFVGDEPPPPEPLTAETKGAAIGVAMRRLRRPSGGEDGPPGTFTWLWRREYRVILLTMLVVALCLLGAAAIAAARMILDSPDDAATTAGTPAQGTGDQGTTATTGSLWYFTSADGLGLYTIRLSGDGTSGTVDVIEDATDSGTYTWTGDALVIDFTRKLTMDDGYVYTDPWRFACTGTRASARMDCVMTTHPWAYSGRDGLELRGEKNWPSVAVPR